MNVDISIKSTGYGSGWILLLFLFLFLKKVGGLLEETLG